MSQRLKRCWVTLALVLATGASVLCLPTYADTTEIKKAKPKKSITTARELTNHGTYSASGTAPDHLTTEGTVKVEQASVFKVDRPADRGRVAWDSTQTSGATAVFKGRSTGWGANYDVEGVYKGAGAGAGGDTKAWFSHFKPDKVRIGLEINGPGNADNVVLPITDGGRLTLSLHDGNSSETYEVTLTAGSVAPDTGMVSFSKVNAGDTFFTAPNKVRLTTANPTRTIKLTGSGAGQFRITGTVDQPNTTVIPANGTISTLVLESVKFGDTTNDDSKTKVVRKDDGSGDYPTPHWQRTGSVQSPVCYVSGNTTTTIKLKVLLKSSETIPADATYFLQGTGTIAGSEQQFTFSNVQAVGRKTENTIEFDVTAGTALPASTIQCFDTMAIEWKYSADATPNWTEAPVAGKSENQVYVILNDNNIDSNYARHTVYHIGCRAAKGETALVSAQKKILASFEERYITKVDGSLLTYYRHYTTASGLFAEFLETTDGRCGSWNTLLKAVICAQGMNEPVDQFLMSSKGIADYRGATGEHIERMSSVEDGFLIANWHLPSIDEDAEAYPVSNVLLKQDSRYHWENTDANDPYSMHGLSGQGNQNPASKFRDHIYAAVQGVNWYFDASYGFNLKQVRKAFLVKYLAGYYKVGDAVQRDGKDAKQYHFDSRGTMMNTHNLVGT